MLSKFIKMSPSSGLALYKDCPLCFWLKESQGISRPRGIFPSLPSGMDLILKNHYDNYRGKLPPELEGKVDGVLMKDLKLMNLWRNWKTGLTASFKELNAMLFGALDDCLVIKVGKKEYYVPLDCKTKGSPPKEGDSELYYQGQLDSYSLMLDSQGYPTADYAILVYYTPFGLSVKPISLPRAGIYFDVTVVKVAVDKKRIKDLVTEAVGVARSSKEPNPNPHCEYCNHHSERAFYDKNKEG